jgi:hypothetical protein
VVDIEPNLAHILASPLFQIDLKTTTTANLEVVDLLIETQTTTTLNDSDDIDAGHNITSRAYTFISFLISL